MSFVMRLVGAMLLSALRFLNRKIMMNDLKAIFKNNSLLENKVAPGEAEFIQQWSLLDKQVSPLSYRFYSKYIGFDKDIVPPDVARNYIEPVLNAGDCIKFYNDKNSFHLFLDPKDMPKVLFRSMKYRRYDGDYNPVQIEEFEQCFIGEERVIVKPAKDLGGRGVNIFERVNGKFVNREGAELTLSYLTAHYKTDYLIQSCFIQSPYIAQFNPSSVNTIRVNTYRDVNTGEIHVLGAALRIGAKGANVDNASSGGGIIAVDENGKLGQCVYNKYGRGTSVYNDIDFASNEYVIPNFSEVKKFARKITTRLPHMGLLALDVVLDATNTPKLIEVNSSSFSVKFLQLTQHPVFGKYTADVINYCKQHKSEIGTGVHM